jgi:ABC-type molybdate transport system permease subunit
MALGLIVVLLVVIFAYLKALGGRAEANLGAGACERGRRAARIRRTRPLRGDAIVDRMLGSAAARVRLPVRADRGRRDLRLQRLARRAGLEPPRTRLLGRDVERPDDPLLVHAVALDGSSERLLATVLGTAAAVGLRNVGRRTRNLFDGFMYTAIIVPEIVIAIASLLFFSTVGIPLGPLTIVATHAVFNTSVVALVCRARLASMDRSLEEAGADLGASRRQTFGRITLPQLFPAVLAGGLLAFTFSFDDVVLSTFVSSPGSTTLPLRIFSELRFASRRRRMWSRRRCCRSRSRWSSSRRCCCGAPIG